MTMFQNNQLVKIFGTSSDLDGALCRVIGIISNFQPIYIMYIVKKENGTFSDGYSAISMHSSHLVAVSSKQEFNVGESYSAICGGYESVFQHPVYGAVRCKFENGIRGFNIPDLITIIDEKTVHSRTLGIGRIINESDISKNKE